MAANPLVTFDPDVSVQANARALWGAVDTFLLANGWAVTADTGQTDPNTMTACASNNTYYATRLYSPTDALTAFVLKLEYGRGSSSTQPSIRITVGRTSNGSGTLSNVSFSAVALNPSGSLTNPSKLYMSAEQGRCMVSWGLWDGAVDWSAGFSVHRSVDSAGAMTSTAVEGQIVSGSGTRSYHTLPLTGTIPSALSNPPCAFGTATSYSVGTSVFLATPMNVIEGAVLNPNPFLMIYGSADLAANLQKELSVYGTTRTYLTTGFITAQYGSGTNARVALLYD